METPGTDMEEHIVIIGGGLAGAKAAEGAREAGYDLSLIHI